MNEFSQLRDEDESFAAVIRPLIMYCMCVMICGENEPPGNIDFISLEIFYLTTWEEMKTFLKKHGAAPRCRENKKEKNRVPFVIRLE